MTRCLARAALATLLVVLPCQAQQIDMGMIKAVTRQFKRATAAVDTSGVPQMLNGAIQFVKDFEPEKAMEANTRRLVNSACDYETAFTALVNGKCGAALPVLLVSADSVFADFCKVGCDVAIKEVRDEFLQKAGCTRDEKNHIRLLSLGCDKGTFGGSAEYCMTQEKFAGFVGELNTLTKWNTTYDTGPFCAADSCYPKMLGAIMGDASSDEKKIWDMILKNMCVKAPGANATCWPDFAGILGGGEGGDVMTEMMNSPKTFCPAYCKRSVLLDILVLANLPAATMKMITAMMDFSCMQKEGGDYCISVVMKSVVSDDAVNYDGKLVQRPVCKEPEGEGGDEQEDENKEEDKEPECSATKGECAPWCKKSDVEGYVCGDNVGKCDDFLKCDTKKGRFEQQTCTCASKISQLASDTGCCLGGAVSFYCTTMSSDPRMANDTSIDHTQCDEDTALTKVKGFSVSKAMARVESCGLVTDPRCTHGKTIATATFTITLKNVDTKTVCASPAKLAKQMQKTIASVVGGAASDFAVELCPSGRRLAVDGVLSPKVTVEESGSTNLAMVEQMKDSSVKSGKFEASIVDNVGLPAVAGKSISVSAVGPSTSATKKGVTASTPAEAALVSKTTPKTTNAAMVSGTTTNAMGMAALVLLTGQLA